MIILVLSYKILRHAHYSKEDYEAAVDAFEQGLKIDPNNANLKANLENAKQRLPSIDSSTSSSGPGAGAGAGGERRGDAAPRHRARWQLEERE